MKKMLKIMCAILSISLMISFMPSEAMYKTAKEKTCQVWQRAKKRAKIGAQKAGAFAQRHKGKLTAVAIIAALEVGARRMAYIATQRLEEKEIYVQDQDSVLGFYVFLLLGGMKDAYKEGGKESLAFKSMQNEVATLYNMKRFKGLKEYVQKHYGVSLS